VTTPRGAGPWAARIAARDAPSLAALRLLPGVEAAQSAEDGSCWIRGATLTDEVESALRRVPGLERFSLLPGDRLAEAGARVPSKRLPSLAWKPIAREFVAAFPDSAATGERPAPVRLRVERSSDERPAAALVTDAASWESWCSTASEIRMKPLRFAACADGRVLVCGAPLPAIAGATLLWDDAGVLTPCGHAPRPDVGGKALRAVFGLREGDVALLGADAAFEAIPAANFAGASRSAARLTRSGLAGV
jgi:hypothetical protein